MMSPAVQGTSLAYTLDRLHRERPDLYAKVVAKEMSDNKAAIAAGFRKQLSPAGLAARAVGKLTDIEWEKLKRQEDQRAQLKPNFRHFC
jgi:hypothetical protein